MSLTKGGGGKKKGQSKRQKENGREEEGEKDVSQLFGFYAVPFSWTPLSPLPWGN